ncbi:MAG: hypothetical protein ACFB0F_03605 [Neomegalonema sp.]
MKKRTDAQKLRQTAELIESGDRSPAMIAVLAKSLREIADRREADLRDEFAMAALQGLLAHASGEDPRLSPELAYELADAMLEARKK